MSLSYLFPMTLQKAFVASNVITTFHGFNTPVQIHLQLTPSIFLFDHPKLEEFACVGENNNKLFLYFLIRMLTGMKAKRLQMCKEKDNWPMIGSKNYYELFKNR